MKVIHATTVRAFVSQGRDSFKRPYISGGIFGMLRGVCWNSKAEEIEKVTNC